MGRSYVTNHDRQCHAMPFNRGELIRRVADAEVVCDRDSVIAAAVCEPSFIRSVRRKELFMPFDRQTGGGKDCGELPAEVAFGEVGKAHAARS